LDSPPGLGNLSSPVFQSLHWLRVLARVQYKVSCICFHSATSTSPHSTFLIFYTYIHYDTTTQILSRHTHLSLVYPLFPLQSRFQDCLTWTETFCISDQ
jgi:hypothetical protein